MDNFVKSQTDGVFAHSQQTGLSHYTLSMSPMPDLMMYVRASTHRSVGKALISKGQRFNSIIAHERKERLLIPGVGGAGDGNPGSLARVC